LEEVPLQPWHSIAKEEWFVAKKLAIADNHDELGHFEAC